MEQKLPDGLSKRDVRHMFKQCPNSKEIIKRMYPQIDCTGSAYMRNQVFLEKLGKTTGGLNFINDKVMNNVLNNILMQCGLIVPLEETETDVLAKACSEYIGNESFTFDDFEELADCYVTNRECKELNDFVTEYISNNDLGNYNFPKRIKCALVFYCIYLAIEESEDDKDAALRSLSLQNVMIQVHGNWEKLNYQDVLYKLYFKYNQYAEGEVIGEKKYPRDFVQSMFIDSFRQGETISEDMTDKIQSLALMAWDAEMSQFIKGLKETNDFLKIQLILEHYFINKPQIPQKEDFIELMQRIFHVAEMGKGKR